MFDPRDPYERRYWHYDTRRPLSMAQLISLRSVDAETAALIWLLLECGTSLTVAGPTDPKPGVGKTTVLNALLQFLPEETVLAYTSGMYEDFAFTELPDTDPALTCVLCNETSDHQPFYMWGRVARRYLMLPSQGYHIATCVHADTIDDVIYMYQHDLRLSSRAVRSLGLVVNIGLVGREPAVQRRWLTTHFLRPEADPRRPTAVAAIPLSLWDGPTDTFVHADQASLDELAQWAKITPGDFSAALEQRIDFLQALALTPGVGMDQMYELIAGFREQAKRSTGRMASRARS